MFNQLNEVLTNNNTIHGLAAHIPGAHHLSTGSGWAYGLIGLGAGVAMVGAIGSGGGQGIAAGRAAEAVGRNPQAEAQIRNMMIIGDGVAASASIYALIISLLLIFVF